jgi:hypothetical protein
MKNGSGWLTLQPFNLAIIMLAFLFFWQRVEMSHDGKARRCDLPLKSFG